MLKENYIHHNLNNREDNQSSSHGSNGILLRDSVKINVRNYLYQLKGQEIEDFYELVLSEVEYPLLDQVMQYCRGNQTRASKMLGINRGTLRKKLKKYDLD